MLNLDLLGFGVLLLMLVVMSAIQAVAALGIMWAMHKYWREKLTETTYGEFDFDNFQKPLLQDLLLRLAIMFAVPTILLHLLEFLFIGVMINRHRAIVCMVLFVLETAAIFAGFHFVFRLDKFRLLVLTGGSALFYLFWLWYLAAGKYLA